MAMLLVGCGEASLLATEEGQEPRSEPAALAPVFSERRPTALGASPTKRLGEDCTTHGASECVSRLCVHAKLQPFAGYYCSVPCLGLEDCPAEWQCVRSRAGTRLGLCIPPPDWNGAAAQAR